MVRLIAGLVVGVAVVAALVLLGLWIGGADCNQGRCNWFGEFIDDTAPLYLVLAAVAGFVAAACLARPPRR